MGVNKVEYGSSTLVDLTGDTVTPETLLQGETAHNAAGNRITGTARPGVQSFNGRSGSVLPMAGDYSAEQVNYDSNKTVKQVIDALATKETSDITGQQSLLKDTVGWTGKNLFNVNTVKELPISVVLNKTDTGIQVRNTVAATWRFASFWITHLPKNTDYIISCNVLITSGKGKILVKDFETQTSIFDVNVEDGEAFTKKFNTGNYNSLYLTVYCATDTAELGNVTYDNLMLHRADILDDTYEPYHESVEVMYEEEIHGVNLFPFIGNRGNSSINGVVCTAVGDGSYTIVGTKTTNKTCYFALHLYERNTLPQKVFFKAFSSDYTYARGLIRSDPQTSPIDDTYDTNGAGAVFSPKKDTNVLVFIAVYGSTGTNINVTVRPMLRKADIEDSTYRPYNHQAIQNQLNAQGVLGAKNLLQNTATSQTINGVTFTVNADGSVTANGTATTNIVTINIPISLPIGKYTFSGTNGQSGGSDSKYYARLRKVGGIQFTSSEVSPLPIESINGSEKTFSVLQDGLDIIYQICIYSAAGAISNLTFKPMLRLASDPDDTYQPYAMTNRELTEEKINIADLKTVVSASSDFADFKTRIASL